MVPSSIFYDSSEEQPGASTVTPPERAHPEHRVHLLTVPKPCLYLRAHYPQHSGNEGAGSGGRPPPAEEQFERV